MNPLLLNLLGYTGSLLLIVAFLLNCMKRLDSASPVYQVMNLVGAGLTLVNAWSFGALPSAVVSAFWVGVFVVFLCKGLRPSRRTTPTTQNG